MTEHNTTRFVRQGRQVELYEDDDGVSLKIDGHPIDVEVVDGKYASHLANMFVDYDDVYQLIDQLFATEGKTWLFGHPHHPHPHPVAPDAGHHGGHHGGGRGGSVDTGEGGEPA